MTTEKIDYIQIIADLEAKRTALDNAIVSLKAVAASGALGLSDGIIPTMAMPFAASGASAGEVPDGAFHGKTIPAAIKLFLGLMHNKQTARQISDGLKKGGMESTSKWFDKIVYATLDRLRKAGEVVKIEGHWGLPEWYPALLRAGATDNVRKPARRGRGRPRKLTSEAERPTLLPSGTDASLKKRLSRAGLKDLKPEPGPGDMIDWFLRDNPGAHSSEEIRAATRIGNLRVAEMLLGTMVKKGKVQKTDDGKYRKAS